MIEINKITQITDLDDSQAQEILSTIKEEYSNVRQKIESALTVKNLKQLLYSTNLLHENLVLTGDEELISFSENALFQINEGNPESISQSIKKLLIKVDKVMHST